jgi:uncharacterized protein
MTLPAHLLNLARHEAEYLLREVGGARAVVVSTIDGFDVAHARRQNIEASRMAAMASSIAALAQVVAHEAGLGAPRCMIVEADEGFVIVRSVPRRDHPLVIELLTDRTGLLGLALQQLSRSGQQLEAA